MDTIGARIREARRHSGLRAVEVTERLGLVRQATIFDLEAGRLTGTPERLTAIADLFGVSLDWLITGRAEHAPSWLGVGAPLSEPDETTTDVSPAPKGCAA